MRLIVCLLLLLAAACARTRVRCDAHLPPINPPAAARDAADVKPPCETARR